LLQKAKVVVVARLEDPAALIVLETKKKQWDDNDFFRLGDPSFEKRVVALPVSSFFFSLSLSLCSFPMRAPEDGVCEDDDVYKKRGKGEKKGPPPPKNLGFFKHQFKVSQKRSSSRLLLREAKRDDGNRLGQKRRQKKRSQIFCRLLKI